MHVDSVPVVVKVYMRSFEEDLQAAAAKLSFIWKELSPARHPSLLPYQCWIKSSLRLKANASPVYLIRQYINTNLHDRISTRPFLHEFEKLWILFQLFKCLELCHRSGVVHGDVKPENVLITSWNWVVLTDFSPFKPTTIPDDDPTDFQYFFDGSGSGRGCCYVAPERFVAHSRGLARPPTLPRLMSSAAVDEVSAELVIAGRDVDINTGATIAASVKASVNLTAGATNAMPFYKTTLKTAMDVFSLGCTMAEVM
jgi:phosphoinositide-3-kinase regulatory subunit 4